MDLGHQRVHFIDRTPVRVLVVVVGTFLYFFYTRLHGHSSALGLGVFFLAEQKISIILMFFSDIHINLYCIFFLFQLS